MGDGLRGRQAVNTNIEKTSDTETQNKDKNFNHIKRHINNIPPFHSDKSHLYGVRAKPGCLSLREANAPSRKPGCGNTPSCRLQALPAGSRGIVPHGGTESDRKQGQDSFLLLYYSCMFHKKNKGILSKKITALILRVRLASL